MSKCTGYMECEHVCPLIPFGFGIGRIIRRYIKGRPWYFWMKSIGKGNND